MLTDGRNTYTWNAENQLKTAAGVTYTYDGDGDRVQKSSGKIYWYGAGSEILAESDSSGSMTDEYVYFGGKRIAHRVVSGNAIYYYAEDFLGSSRVMTTSTGTVCYDADFYPFGGERVVTNTCPQNYKFTGKERDAETNNDDFGARYYSSQFGRWTSPDWSAIPAPVPYANLTNPQTLNLYAMVHDNPETFSDLDGHDDAMLQAGKVEVNNQPENPSEAKQSQEPNAPQPPPQDQNAAAPVTVLGETMEKIDAVVKPLIESASEEVTTAIGALSSAAVAASAVAVAVLATAPAVDANEGKMLQQARAAEDAHNSAEHKKGARESTHDDHTAKHSSRTGDKLRQRSNWEPKKKAGGERSRGSKRDKGETD